MHSMNDICGDACNHYDCTFPGLWRGIDTNLGTTQGVGLDASTCMPSGSRRKVSVPTEEIRLLTTQLATLETRMDAGEPDLFLCILGKLCKLYSEAASIQPAATTNHFPGILPTDNSAPGSVNISPDLEPHDAVLSGGVTFQHQMLPSVKSPQSFGDIQMDDYIDASVYSTVTTPLTCEPGMTGHHGSFSSTPLSLSLQKPVAGLPEAYGGNSPVVRRGNWTEEQEQFLVAEKQKGNALHEISQLMREKLGVDRNTNILSKRYSRIMERGFDDAQFQRAVINVLPKLIEVLEEEFSKCNLLDRNGAYVHGIHEGMYKKFPKFLKGAVSLVQKSSV